MIEDDRFRRDDAIRFLHRRAGELCPAGFDLVSNSVAFQDDDELFAREGEEDVVILAVIRCRVAEPAPAPKPVPAPLSGGRQPVVPTTGGPGSSR